MDEMTMLRDLGEELAPTGTLPPAGLRDACLARPPRGRRRRVVQRGGLLLVAAAALTGALVIAPMPLPGDGRSGGTPAAAAVFDRAAQRALTQPNVQVPPGSFVYVESTSRPLHTELSSDGTVTRSSDPGTTRRTWLSAWGGEVGLQRSRAVGWTHWLADEPVAADPVGAYRADLPTSTAAMATYIDEHLSGFPGQSPEARALTTVSGLIDEAYVPPASLAALFRAAGRIPGAVVTEGVRDVLGRPAIAVGVTDQRQTSQLLFDPQTYAFLGERELQSEASEVPDLPGVTFPVTPAGTVLGEYAVTALAIVPDVGVMP